MSVTTSDSIVHVYQPLYVSMLLMLAGMGAALGALMVNQGAEFTLVAESGIIVACLGFLGSIYGTVRGEKKLEKLRFNG